MSHILIVEDDIVFSTLLNNYLIRNDFSVSKVASLKEAKQRILDTEISIVLLDYHLPDGTGLELLEWIKKESNVIEVLFMTSVVDIKVAVQAIKKGAADYITKPINQDELLMQIKNIVKNNIVKINNDSKVQDASENYVKGKSPVMQEVYSFVHSVAPTNLNVLIVGETGTGKEHIAKMIHVQSIRNNKPFIAVDCGVLSVELAASELFGHVKGSFTGALVDKIGQFELANGGTLFLDEIGNLPYEVQIKLLRTIQEKEIVKVGGSETKKIDVRIIAATNEDFLQALHNNSFREDLYHRINEFQIKLPALRERKEDLEALCDFFMQKSNKEFNKQVSQIADELKLFFNQYYWPGNIRELQNVLRRAVLLTKDEVINSSHLPAEMLHAKKFTNTEKHLVDSYSSIKDVKELHEKKLIIKTLIETKFNKSKTAKILQIDRSTLYAKMEKYGIDDA